MPSALVIDHGDSRSALAGARGLAGAGWRVGIGSPTPRGLAPVSRAVSRWHHVVGPEQGIDGFVAGVNAAVAEGGYDVVLPSDDEQVLALSLRRAEIHARVPYPAHGVVLRAVDKLELHRAAQRAGLASPRTVEASLEALAAWNGPAVVKPRMHNTLEQPGAPTHLPVRRVPDAAAASRQADLIRAAGGAPLLQEPIDGDHLAFSAVADASGRIVARVQQRALRLYPPKAGISARAVTEAVDDRLGGQVQALFAELGWIGLAQLQLRVPADGVPRLIDFNARFYGSLALALHAGANLPAGWAEVGLGRAVAPSPPARPDVHYQWLEGDLRTAGAGLDGQGRVRDVVSALVFALRAGHSVWDPRDPRPGLRLAGRLPRRAARQAARLRDR